MADGVPGYQYCYVTSTKGQGLYAWNAQSGDLQKMDSTYTWKATGWKRGQPLPWEVKEEQKEEKGDEEIKKDQKSKEISKLNEAKSSPNQWITVSNGVEGASYRYSTIGKDKGLYAWNINYKMLMKLDTRTYEWENTGWTQGQPLPWEVKEVDEEVDEEVDKGVKKGGEEEVEKKEKVEEKEVEEISELKEAKENPNKWLTIKSGLKGFRYCYSTAGSGSLLALNPDGDILQHNISSNTWDAIAWDSSIPLPEGMKVGTNGKLENIDPRKAIHQKKLDEAMRHPDVWRNLEHGVNGVVYCYVEKKGFYAYSVKTGLFYKSVLGSSEFKVSTWTKDIPKPPGLRINKSGLVIRIGGAEIGTPESEGLSGSEYVERAKEVITSRSDYIKFEETFIDPYQPGRRFGITNDMEIQIREHGREITGIATLERTIENRYGISIESENTSVHGRSQVECSRCGLRFIERQLQQIDTQLSHYPQEIFDYLRTGNAPLQIYLFDNWSSTYKGKKFRAGGFSFGQGKIGVNNVLHALDHELLHALDYVDGGMDDEDALWGTSAHGKNYSSLYGKHGAEAIIAGTANGARPKGFALKYGKAGGIDEDQATVAETMLRSPSDYRKIKLWASKEPALAMKMELTKKYYEKWSNGKMDPKFWEEWEASDGKNKLAINKDYWDKKKV